MDAPEQKSATPQDRALKSWDTRARSYLALTLRYPIFSLLADRLISQLPGNFSGSALDLGAGAGLISERLLERFPTARVHLLEPAPGMMALAQDRLSGLVSGFYRDKAEEMGEVGLRWDAVLCNAAFHLMEERSVLAAVSGILRGEGVFCFNLWGHSFEATADLDPQDAQEEILAMAAAGLDLPLPLQCRHSRPRVRRLAALRRDASQAGMILEGPWIDKDEVPLAFFLDFSAMSPEWPAGLEPLQRSRLLERASSMAEGSISTIHSVRFLARKLSAVQ